MRPRGSTEELERRRSRAVALMEEGVPRKWLARVLGVSRGSLSRWRRLADSGELKAKPQPGAQSKLSVDDYKELERLLLMGATSHGWNNNLWTASRVSRLIFVHFGVKYHPAHVSRLLRRF
jgi:transposase